MTPIRNPEVCATRRGFTLIELLVVIAIIAILAAILFPVFSTAREKARQTTCTSNLKQLSLAVLQYTQDNDETLPSLWMYVISSGKTTQTAIFDATKGSIYPYVKSTSVYICPEDLSGQLDSYSLNSLIKKVPLSQFQAPSLTVMFNEEADGYRGGTDDGYCVPATNPVTKRHTNGGIFSFMDGHVKWHSNSGLVYSATPSVEQPRYQP